MSPSGKARSRAFAPSLEVALESRELMTARVVDRVHPGPPAPAEVQAAPVGVPAPHIASKQLIVRGKAVTGVAVSFSQPMEPGSVTDARNYTLIDPGVRSRNLKDALVPIKVIRYDPATATATLVPARPLKPSGTYLLTNVDITNPLRTQADYARAFSKQSRITSLAGVSLNADTGTGGFAELVTRRSRPGLLASNAW